MRINIKLVLVSITLSFTLCQLIGFSQSCSQIRKNYFSCGVRTSDFEYMRAKSVNGGSQIQSNWCWAACIQMVLNYHELNVNQKEVVTRIYGLPYVNRTAGEQQILSALTGWAPDSRGRLSRIHAYGGYTSLRETIKTLSHKCPLIVGLSNPHGGVGHVYVLTAIYYSYRHDNAGKINGYIPDKVVLRDPWPSSPSRQEMSWREFQSRCSMAIKVWVTSY